MADEKNLIFVVKGNVESLNKALGDAERNTKRSIGNIQKTLESAGKQMMLMGGVIAAGLGLAVKAAEEERVGIMQLASIMENVGVAYDDVKDSLEELIATQQLKTGMADDQQRKALGDLIIATNSYEKAVELLPLALDLAAAKEIELGRAVELVGKVAAGNMGTLSRYGIILKEGATAAEALAILQERVGGSAEAMASPLEIAKAALGDLSETIGGVLLPAFNELLENNIIPFVSKLQEFVKQNPGVIKAVGGLAIALLAGGGLIYAMSMLSKAIVTVNAALIIMHSLTGVGLVKVIAGLAVAAGAIFGMTKLMEGATAPEPVMFEGQDVSGFSEKTKELMGVPGYAMGGIVTSPTLAMVGESGPEAIVPLGQGVGTTLNISVGNYMGDEMSLRRFTQTIQRILGEETRRVTYAPNKTEYYSQSGHL